MSGNQQDIDNKIDNAVSQNMEGGAASEEEFDEFFQEAFSGEGESGAAGIADYEEDLGYGIDTGTESEEDAAESGEDPAEDTGQEGSDEGDQDGEGQEDASDEAAQESSDDGEEKGEEGADDGDKGKKSEAAEQQDGEGDEGAGGEEEAEEALFYDAERDFGKQVPPTKYETRIDLNQGLVAKVNYYNQLQSRLKGAGTDIGALPVPELANGDPESINQYADIEAVMSLPDDQAKAMVKDMDVLLKGMKSKAERFEARKEQAEKKEQLSQEYVDSRTKARRAIKELKLKINPDLTNQEILDMAYQVLEDFENNDENNAELTQKEFLEQVRQMEDHIFALEDFAQKAIEFETQKQQTSDGKPSPEQIKTAFKEFREDQPGLEIFQVNNDEAITSFIQTAKAKGWAMGSARDWANNYRKYMKIIEVNRAKKKMDQIKSGKQEKKDTAGEKGTKKTSRAQKTGTKKIRPSGVTYTNRSANENIDKLDEDIDQLTEQMFGDFNFDEQF